MTVSVSDKVMQTAKYPDGTLRCWFKRGYGYWGVSFPSDEWRANCLLAWPKLGGEILENGQWRPMKQNNTNGAATHHD